MKKIALLALILGLALCACVPALAATKPLTIAVEKEITLTEGESKDLLTTTINSTESGKVRYTLTDMVTGKVVYKETRKNLKAGKDVAWPLPYYDKGMSNQKSVKRLQAAFKMDGKTYTLHLYYNYSRKNGQAAQITVEKDTWYSNNTACSFGPQFRVVQPKLTDKWYMFTPIDLTQQGVQEFEYVASNMYVIGKVYVTVYGDVVTVSYENFYEKEAGQTKTLTEYLYFFHDFASVDQVEPEKRGPSDFAFDRPIRISEDLEGDTNVLMFIRNEVTYSTYANATHKLTRFWPNLDERKALRESMLALMD